MALGASQANAQGKIEERLENRMRTNWTVLGVLAVGLSGCGAHDLHRDLLGFLAGQVTAPDDGESGIDGIDGIDGLAGLACWDLNENGVFDPETEDFDGDGESTAYDCRGIPGEDGEDGEDGGPGAAGTAGAAGAAGSTGPAGAPGIGIQGPVGPQGAQGPQGPQGQPGQDADDDDDKGKEHIVICHKGKTKTIKAYQWPKHQGHGDTLGACDDDDNDND